MMPVFMGEGLFHGLRQLFAGRLLLLMIEKDIRPLMLAPAVYVDKDGPFIGLFVFLREGVDPVHPLFEAAHLVEGDRAAHAGLPLAVLQELLVADAILRVLDDDMHLGSLFQQDTGQPERDVVGILILMQLMAIHLADRAGVRAAVPAHQIETGSFQLGGGYLVVR